jgi:hypothetical protein
MLQYQDMMDQVAKVELDIRVLRKCKNHLFSSQFETFPEDLYYIIKEIKEHLKKLKAELKKTKLLLKSKTVELKKLNVAMEKLEQA